MTDFILRKATPLPLKEYQSPPLKEAALKADFGREKTAADTSWRSTKVPDITHSTEFKHVNMYIIQKFAFHI